MSPPDTLKYSIAVLFTLFGYSIDVPMTAICYMVIEKALTLKTHYFGTVCRIVWIIPRRGPRFELQLYT